MATLFNANEVYAIAINVEENGKKFYLGASARATDPELKGMLAELAEWESGHVKQITQLRAKLPASVTLQTPMDPNGELAAYLKAVADNHVFRDDWGLQALLDSCKNSIEMLNLGIRFETEAVNFYTMLKRLIPDYMGAEYLDQLIAEEQQHAQLLKGKVFALSSLR